MTGGAQTVSVSCTRGTITTPGRFNAVAAEAMKILAYASTRYAQIRLNGDADSLDGGLGKLTG